MSAAAKYDRCHMTFVKTAGFLESSITWCIINKHWDCNNEKNWDKITDTRGQPNLHKNKCLLIVTKEKHVLMERFVYQAQITQLDESIGVRIQAEVSILCFEVCSDYLWNVKDKSKEILIMVLFLHSYHFWSAWAITQTTTKKNLVLNLVKIQHYDEEAYLPRWKTL